MQPDPPFRSAADLGSLRAARISRRSNEPMLDIPAEGLQRLSKCAIDHLGQLGFRGRVQWHEQRVEGDRR